MLSWLLSLREPKEPPVERTDKVTWTGVRCEDLSASIAKYVTDIEAGAILRVGGSVWIKKEQLGDCSIEDLGFPYSRVTSKPIEYKVQAASPFPAYTRLWIYCTDPSDKLGYIVGRTHSFSTKLDIEKVAS